MLSNIIHNITSYAPSALLAFMPALIWLTLIFKKTKKKKIQVLLFVLGTCTVIPIFIMQAFLKQYPQFDVVNFLDGKITNQNIGLMIMFLAVGITEEIAKQSFVRMADRKFLLIETINDSIQFSLVSALGFSFAENIFYTYSIWTHLGLKQLFVAFTFRSIFTTCAHLIFSGFFGYYYGIAKFSLNIREQSKWTGKKQIISNLISKITGMPRSQALKEQMILKGLMIAIVLHAFFDFILQLNQILPAVLFVVFGYFILQHLLKSKAGSLIMVSDVTEQRTSSIAKTDEDVVIELVGMWFNEKRYVDVLHICQRILERDPDNKIVQLFKAQAMDKMDETDPFNKALSKLFPAKTPAITLEKLLKEKHESGKTEPTPAPIAGPAVPAVPAPVSVTPATPAQPAPVQPPPPPTDTFTLNNLDKRF